MMMTMMVSALLISFQSLTESDELECDELDTLPLDEPDELDTAATHLIITLSRTSEISLLQRGGAPDYTAAMQEMDS